MAGETTVCCSPRGCWSLSRIECLIDVLMSSQPTFYPRRHMFCYVVCIYGLYMTQRYDADRYTYLLSVLFSTVVHSRLSICITVGPSTKLCFTLVFNGLRVPIAPYETVGPTVHLQNLGILLGTGRMKARLPDEKLNRIINILDILESKRSILKRQLLNLLGHLHFASTGSKRRSLSFISGSLCETITS